MLSKFPVRDLRKKGFVMSVRIITDSASDMSPAEHPALRVLPLSVTFGTDVYMDGVDIDHQRFYEMLVERDELPKTGQVNPYAFSQAIAEAREAGDEAVIITVGAKLSGTNQSARTALAEAPGGDVFVVDSNNVTLGERVLVEYALRLVDEGRSAAQIAAAVEAVRDLIVEDARQQYGEMEETIGETGLRDLERRVVLAVLDRKWREHLYEMDYLKDGIGLRGMGQRDPLVEYQREGYQMYNSMIEAIKEETVQLLFHIDIKQVATTDEAVDEVEETAESADTIAVASGPDENGESVVEAAEGEVEEEDEDTDAKQAIAESAAASGAGESTLPVAGPAPISHAEGKVPVSKRPKSEELKTPWADGRTFPGTGKNAPCPCGSGRKYKMCHGQNEK